MANPKYIRNNAGVLTETASAATGGAGDEDKIPQLDGSGKLKVAMMPTGIGPETATIDASENLAAGDYVNIHNSSGVKARKADATTAGKHAHGFVLAAVTSGQPATVYFQGLNDQVSSQTVGGDVFLTATAGIGSSTAPSSSGNIVQKLGVAISATAVKVEIQNQLVLA